jgi:hypothetical protein
MDAFPWTIIFGGPESSCLIDRKDSSAFSHSGKQAVESLTLPVNYAHRSDFVNLFQANGSGRPHLGFTYRRRVWFVCYLDTQDTVCSFEAGVGSCKSTIRL